MKNELSDKIDLREWTNFKMEEKVSLTGFPKLERTLMH